MKHFVCILFVFSLTRFVSAQTNGVGISASPFATGFNYPVEIVHAKDNRLFVVEQSGKIIIVQPNGTKLSTPFLDVSGRITTGNLSQGSEMGLLGLAFHPNYKNNGVFFINYINASGNTAIEKCTVSSSDSNVANPLGTVILNITQPFSNHNGGTMKFGSDNYLYIGSGDGGSANDPGDRAQNINTLLGKMLRIDIDTAIGYKIPPTNPYLGIAGADEIWALGLRNPWKFSFDPLTNDLWIADVGQNAYEEVNKAGGNPSGMNYGWRCYEASFPFNTSNCGGASLYKTPILSINHNTGACSVTGGYVYRGTNYPNLYGKYLFTDYCLAKIGLMDTSGNVVYSSNYSGKNFSTFGEDYKSELYIADRSSNGQIFKIIGANPLSIQEIESNSQFAIFPNPTNEYLFVKSKYQMDFTGVEVKDIHGAMVLKSNFINNKLDVKQLTKGAYFLYIKNSKGFISKYRFIKQD